jgi:hypothetical protein
MNLIGGQQVKNIILLALPENERTCPSFRGEFVRLPLATKLAEKGAQMKSAYFLNEGLVSALSVMDGDGLVAFLSTYLLVDTTLSAHERIILSYVQSVQRASG